MAKTGRPMNRETMEDEIVKGREEIRRNGNENWKVKHVCRQQREEIGRLTIERDQLAESVGRLQEVLDSLSLAEVKAQAVEDAMAQFGPGLIWPSELADYAHSIRQAQEQPK